ncbi:MAG: DUF971 domain-containing protein [Deltaproteobacteria bacterium]|jgi:DUF971 family protein|nr:DUF971 domain-containing protein [Deltaproteobacteria bacterium]MBT4266958.1 DUF971 domain-containing protein [Deltaproteobacteria bacterium]MBT4639679.1 DUF971 domain-containing protein [Deltaproteobacteria bacterium]MBT6504884.1 DUF971 domain-containing protein [Deltaproteobacteria bacterium]MBT6612260.1 DUF971 domain-containing protein [Deltaproteobacteria bacterium]
MAGSKLSTRPKEITFDGRMHIIWHDGAHTIYNYWDLRTACPCASCVDELTGEKVLDDNSVPKEIHPVKSAYIGNYALEILWSDDHNTGIYTFQKLRDEYPHSTAAI